MKTKQIISIITNLPFDQQVEIVDQFLQTFHQPGPDVVQDWMNEVERRVREVDSGKVEMISGDQAMQRLRSIYGK